MTKPLFDLGRVVATPGALEAMADTGDDPAVFLGRHVTGDWGDLDAEDKAENDYSLPRYLRLFSAYKLSDGRKVWLITEADRSATTLLLPSEY
jgi:hypothetical protein